MRKDWCPIGLLNITTLATTTTTTALIHNRN